MKLKKCLFLIILISLLCIGSVSATDDNAINALDDLGEDLNLDESISGNDLDDFSSNNLLYDNLEDLDSNNLLSNDLKENENIISSDSISSDIEESEVSISSKIEESEVSISSDIEESEVSISSKIEESDNPFSSNTNAPKNLLFSTEDNDIISKSSEAVVTVTPSAETYKYGSDVRLTVNLTGIDGVALDGIVILTIDAKQYLANVTGGSTNVIISGLENKTYSVFAEFLGNDLYEPSINDDATFTVNKSKLVTAEVTVEDILYGETVTINISNLTDVDGNALSVFGGYQLVGPTTPYGSFSVRKGKGTISLNNLPAGNYSAYIVFGNNMGQSYEFEYYIANFTVSKANPTLFASAEDISFGENGTVEISVNGVKNERLNETLLININGETYGVIDAINGIANLNIPDLSVGNYTVEIWFSGLNSTNYNWAEYTCSFNVNKASPTLTVLGDEVDYGEPATVSVKLTDKDGNPIVGTVIVSVDLGLDGIDEIVLTDEDGEGEAIFPVQLYGAYGTYDVIAKFMGDDIYASAEDTDQIVIAMPTEITFDLGLDEGNTIITVSNATDANDEPVDGYIMGEIFKGDDKIADLTMSYLEEGAGTIALPDLSPGDYSAMITVMDEEMEFYGTGEISFTVEPKAGVQITAAVEDYPFTEEGNLVVDLTDASGALLSGNLTIILDGEAYDVIEITDGHRELGMSFIDIGKHNMEVIFTNPDYLDAASIAHFEVLKVNPLVKVTGAAVEYGDPAAVKVEVSYGDILAQGRVIVVVDWGVDGLTEVIVLDEGAGEASFQLSPYVADGEYTITATYLGDDRFNEVVNNTEKVIVTPSKILDISVTANQPTEGEDVILTIAGVDGSGADVSVTAANISIDGVTDVYEVAEDGTVNLGPLSAGSHEIEVIVDDGFHTPGGEYITVLVSEPPMKCTVITVNASDISFGDLAIIEFTLKDIDGNDMDGILNVTVGDINKTVNVTGGKGNVTVADLSAGICPVVAGYEGNVSYAPSTSAISFNVAKNSSKIIFKDMETYTVNSDIDGRIGEYFEVSLVDANGNPLANKIVQIGFNGKVYSRTTNATGGAKLQINLARADIYTFAIAFLGDENYTGTFEVAKITTAKTVPQLAVPNKSYKATAKTKALTATLKSTKGSPIAGKTVTFTVNGKSYNGKTNSNGVASVNISLTAKGTYTVTTKYAGDNTFKATRKTSSLKLT